LAVKIVFDDTKVKAVANSQRYKCRVFVFLCKVEQAALPTRVAIKNLHQVALVDIRGRHADLMASEHLRRLVLDLPIIGSQALVQKEAVHEVHLFVWVFRIFIVCVRVQLLCQEVENFSPVLGP